MMIVPYSRCGWGLFVLKVAAFIVVMATIGPAQMSTASGKPTALGKVSRRVALYVAVGAELTQYNVDGNAASLIKQGAITLPANIQEACFHPSGQYIYIV